MSAVAECVGVIERLKRRYLEEWCEAVNAHGGFGEWSSAVAKTPGEIRDILITGNVNG